MACSRRFWVKDLRHPENLKAKSATSNVARVSLGGVIPQNKTTKMKNAKEQRVTRATSEPDPLKKGGKRQKLSIPLLQPGSK